VVNRFYWYGRPGKAGAAEEWDRLRLNVSTDWAPGSSGAAVLDACGNAIGHVTSIMPMREGRTAIPVEGEEGKTVKRDRFQGATLITLRDATPARAMRTLAGGLEGK
jgi:hypothetical protein